MNWIGVRVSASDDVLQEMCLWCEQLFNNDTQKPLKRSNNDFAILDQNWWLSSWRRNDNSTFFYFKDMSMVTLFMLRWPKSSLK